MKNKKPAKGCMGNVSEGLESYLSNSGTKKKASAELPNVDKGQDEEENIKKVSSQKDRGTKK